MAIVVGDRVRDTSTTTGTGAFALSGTPPTSYRTFSAICTTNDNVAYVAVNRLVNEWEVGLATYSSANTLTRSIIYASSTGGTAVSFTAGTKDVVHVHTAENVPLLLKPNTFSAIQTVSFTGGALPADTSGGSLVMQLAATDSVAPIFLIDGFGGTPIWAGRRAGGTFASKSATPQGATLLGSGGMGYGAAYTGIRVAYNQNASRTGGAWTAGNQGTDQSWWTTPDSSTTMVETMVLDNAGDLSFQGKAWIATTPTPLPTIGSFTSATCTLHYKKLGRAVQFQVLISITTNGSGAGAVTVALPFTSTNSLGGQAFCGYIYPTGITCAALVLSNSTTLTIARYDGAYPGLDGNTIVVGGVYEAST